MELSDDDNVLMFVKDGADDLVTEMDRMFGPDAAKRESDLATALETELEKEGISGEAIIPAYLLQALESRWSLGDVGEEIDKMLGLVAKLKYPSGDNLRIGTLGVRPRRYILGRPYRVYDLNEWWPSDDTLVSETSHGDLQVAITDSGIYALLSTTGWVDRVSQGLFCVGDVIISVTGSGKVTAHKLGEVEYEPYDPYLKLYQQPFSCEEYGALDYDRDFPEDVSEAIVADGVDFGDKFQTANGDIYTIRPLAIYAHDTHVTEMLLELTCNKPWPNGMRKALYTKTYSGDSKHIDQLTPSDLVAGTYAPCLGEHAPTNNGRYTIRTHGPIYPTLITSDHAGKHQVIDHTLLADPKQRYPTVVVGKSGMDIYGDVKIRQGAYVEFPGYITIWGDVTIDGGGAIFGDKVVVNGSLTLTGLHRHHPLPKDMVVSDTLRLVRAGIKWDCRCKHLISDSPVILSHPHISVKAPDVHLRNGAYVAGKVNQRVPKV